MINFVVIHLLVIITEGIFLIINQHLYLQLTFILVWTIHNFYILK